MTKEETKKAIEIMQAYVDGKEVEELIIDEWVTIKEPSWNFISCKYRVKPELHLRPYKNKEEFLKAMKEHDGWMEHIDGYFVVAPVFACDSCVDIIGGGGSSVNHGYKRIAFAELLKFFTWIDGTPCGIMEE